MNLYKTTGDGVSPGRVRWSGSQAASSKDRVAMKKQGYLDVGTNEVDVPTNKAGLIEFLNKLGAV
jgi:hypothetical protein